MVSHNSHNPAPPVTGCGKRAITRRVSFMCAGDVDLDRKDSFDSDGQSSRGSPTKVKESGNLKSHLTRQVSHDGISSFIDTKNDQTKRFSSESGRGSPVRCVSEFDKATALSFREDETQLEEMSGTPFHPSPLLDKCLMTLHTRSVRLEAELLPMQLILSRLMSHLTLNRKGIFNTPVDPVALGLSDYFSVIKKPMDLGTVKKRLHAIEYNSRREVADDIRLCFHNAMTYNPPYNAVHQLARDLLAFFEEQLESFCPELASSPISVVQSSLSNSAVYASPPSGTDIPNENSSVLSDSNHPTNCSESDGMNKISFSDSSSTRNNVCSTSGLMHHDTTCGRKRKKRGSKVNHNHCCQWCEGRTCQICNQGCLSLEPTLLICNGPQCAANKVRKGATYYVAPDGNNLFCQRCFVCLPAVLPLSGKPEETTCRYKRDLLKRKNDEEVVERWVTCSECQTSVHEICVMYNPIASNGMYTCPGCTSCPASTTSFENSNESENSTFTFVSGSDMPVGMSEIREQSHSQGNVHFTADTLPETPTSKFIEQKVRDRMKSDKFPNAEKTISLRIISDCDRIFHVPDTIRNHFESGDGASPPLKVFYRSKAIALFQKIDGLDVCIFSMYVHEYNGENDVFANETDRLQSKQEKRVYIAYLDSVEHFRPRTLRTAVYQEILTAYLASARKRGYKSAHIWACPPSRGNSFVFWNHPAAQRTPNMERLTAWYHSAIARSISCGVVTDVKSLYESDFEDCVRHLDSDSSFDITNKMTCPPLLEGDFWVDQAVRLHSSTISRGVKEVASVATADNSSEDLQDPCPAIQVAAMIREKILSHPDSLAFRQPVNAAAMKLKDYHKIVSKPMDLGTVYSKCILGDYEFLEELVADVELVISNAKAFNPPGHIVHLKAVEVHSMFLVELNNLTKGWDKPTEGSANDNWELFRKISMNLGYRLSRVDGLSVVSVDSSIGGPILSAALESDLQILSDDSKSNASSKEYKSVSTESSSNSLPGKTSPPVGLLSGPDAVHHRMVGRDIWLLDKKSQGPPKDGCLTNKKTKRKKSCADSLDEPAPKRRRQTWLGEEVAKSVRRMRTSFFSCSLDPGKSEELNQETQIGHYNNYIGSFPCGNGDSEIRSSRIADSRNGFLEFSQFRNLEFDTLRKSKYSSSIILYHLHNDGAPGLVPSCTSCEKEIEGTRWHRTNKVFERRPVNCFAPAGRKPKVAKPNVFIPQELCTQCYLKISDQDQFVPLQISL